MSYFEEVHQGIMLSVDMCTTYDVVIKKRKRSHEGWNRLGAASSCTGALGAESSETLNRAEALELNTNGFGVAHAYRRRALRGHSKGSPLVSGTRTASMIGFWKDP